MKKYYLMDADTLRESGPVFGSRRLFRHSALMLVLLAVSLSANVLLYFSGRAAKREAARAYEAAYTSAVDSMRSDVDYALTLSEECGLHTRIGELSIAKGRPTERTKENVWEFIKSLDTWYPEYIMAQAVIESGCGANTPAGTHNMFGMKVPSTRETTATNVGGSGTYARYRNWELGVIDRVLWELHVFGHRKPPLKDYLARLSTYAEDEEYLAKIERVASEYRGR